MAQRGRKSAAELAVPAQITTLQRPDAPYDLTDEQSEEWWRVVNSMPADWFPVETHAALAALCRHIVRARRVAQLLDQEERSTGELDVDRYGKLQRMEHDQTRTILSAMTKLRITQQTRYDKSKKREPSVKRPWE